MKKLVLVLIGVFVVLVVVSLYYFVYLYPTGFSTSPVPPDAVLTGIYIPSTAKVGNEVPISLTIKNNEDVNITCQSRVFSFGNRIDNLKSSFLDLSEVKNITHSVVFSEPGILSGEIRVYCQTDILGYDPRVVGSPYFRKSGAVQISSDLSLPSNVNVLSEPSYYVGKENLLTLIEFDISVSE